MLTSGIVEFSFAFYQWNAAAKAVQLGARLASVSDPVASDLKTMTGLEGGGDPGAAMPYFKRVCSGAAKSCSGGSYSSAAMNTLVFGRGDTVCQTAGPDLFPGMCDIFNRIRPENVIVTYEWTGLGFAGRPGGPVPAITVELTGLSFEFVFLNALLGFNALPIPGLKATATGEDLSASN